MSNVNYPEQSKPHEAFKVYKVLDCGFVRLVDCMPSPTDPHSISADAAIVQAARVSYGQGTKSVSEDKSLITYLIKHKHCYHPDMEVLTSDGWKKWKECRDKEEFVVPHFYESNIEGKIETKFDRFSFEKLDVKSFDCNEPLISFKSSKMSFNVTSEHKMFFKEKYKNNYKLIKINEMKKWGHFFPLLKCNIDKDNLEESNDYNMMKFIGFYLGDGSSGSKNTVCFHIKKQRKIEYLTKILEKLNFKYSEKINKNKTHTFYIKCKEYIDKYIDFELKAKDKKLKCKVNELTDIERHGILDGLINSDGHINNKKNRIEFSTKSKELNDLFNTLCSLEGMDAHYNKINNKMFRSYCYNNSSNTTLEARPKYFSDTEVYKGKVFCATTSSGLLIVRGSSNEFSFICGNTSPLEMIEFKFHCRMPIFVARQWIRHRTANVNEYSARYSEVQDMSYLPEEFVIMGQGVSNKQGSEGELNSNTKYEFIKSLESLSIKAYHEYKKALENGIARETARMLLPVSYYTEWYWKIDLHNLFHFIRLRNDSHAQYEIRVYAEAMYDIVKKIAPIASDAFESFVRNSVSVSSLEKECLRLIVNDGLKIEESIEIISNKYNMTKRKTKELKDIIENILIENK